MIKCIWVRAQYGNHVLHAKIVTCHVTCGVFHVMSHVGYIMCCHMCGVSSVVTYVVYYVLSHVWYIMSCHMCDISCVLCKDCHMSNNTWVQRALMTRQHRAGQCSTIDNYIAVWAHNLIMYTKHTTYDT